MSKNAKFMEKMFAREFYQKCLTEYIFPELIISEIRMAKLQREIYLVNQTWKFIWPKVT